MPLWDGHVPADWSFVLKDPAPGETAIVRSGADGVLQVAGKPIGYFATRRSFADYELAFEWRWTEKPGNSGVLLHLGGTETDKVWPNCLQVQMKAGTAGEFIPMTGFAFAELPLGAKAAPRAIATREAAPGEWNVCRIVCRGDTIECWLNGILANRATKCSANSGRIGFQLEGAPFELRGLVLKKL